jgi:hypothetical protein
MSAISAAADETTIGTGAAAEAALIHRVSPRSNNRLPFRGF